MLVLNRSELFLAVSTMTAVALVSIQLVVTLVGIG